MVSELFYQIVGGKELKKKKSMKKNRRKRTEDSISNSG